MANNKGGHFRFCIKKLIKKHLIPHLFFFLSPPVYPATTKVQIQPTCMR